MKKRQIKEGIESSNQKRIRTHAEMRIYKYLEILKTDTMKQAGIKKKKERSSSDERENLLKPSLTAEIPSKE